jgi:hypothetical protein
VRSPDGNVMATASHAQVSFRSEYQSLWQDGECTNARKGEVNMWQSISSGIHFGVWKSSLHVEARVIKYASRWFLLTRNLLFDDEWEGNITLKPTFV